MSLTMTSPRVTSRQRLNPDTQRRETVWEVCVTLQNDGAADVSTCVTLYEQVRNTTPGSPPGAVITTVCTRDVTVPRRRTITDKDGNVVIEMNGSRQVCCRLSGEPLNGQEFVALAGTTKDKDGDVTYGGAGNLSSPTGTYNRPRRVSIRPGQRIDHATLIGIGLPATEEALIGGALELPEGWTIDFPDGIEGGPFPVAVGFGVTAAPVAKVGACARVTLRVDGMDAGTSGPDETTIEFAVEAEPQGVKTPASGGDCCDD